MIAALLGLIVLLIIGAETGPVEMMIGLVCATLPVPIYLMLLLWIDRFEGEPSWMLATAFFWGAIVAVFVALILNTFNRVVVAAATHSMQIGENFGAVISAPLVEESAKAFIILLLFFLKKDEFDGIIDGIVYAGMVGLGFAMTENILYYGRAVHGGLATLTVVFVMRGMASPFFHPLATSMTGIGFGWSRQSDNGFVKVTAPVIGFMLAVLLHGLWNGFATYGSPVAFFAAYFLIMGPAFIVALMVVAFSLRREGRIIRQYLYSDFQRGFFDPQEYECLCSVFGRMRLSWKAFNTGGLSEWRRRKRYHQLASELAFHRSRVARRIASISQMTPEREQAYLADLEQMRRQMVSVARAR
jgi:RsiW-degrading membrane proteinase PrsW (M82 family)